MPAPSGYSHNRIRLADRFKKLRDGMRSYLYQEFNNQESTEVEDSGEIVNRYVQKDGRTVETSGSADSQKSGTYKEDAKSAGVDEDDVTHTTATASAEETEEQDERVGDGPQEVGSIGEDQSDTPHKPEETEKGDMSPGDTKEVKSKKPQEGSKPDNSMSSMASQDSSQEHAEAETQQERSKEVSGSKVKMGSELQKAEDEDEGPKLDYGKMKSPEADKPKWKQRWEEKGPSGRMEFQRKLSQQREQKTPTGKVFNKSSSGWGDWSALIAKCRRVAKSMNKADDSGKVKDISDMRSKKQEESHRRYFEQKDARERQQIHQALQHKGGDIDAAASYLGMGRSSDLKAAMAQLGMDPRDYGPGSSGQQKHMPSTGKRTLGDSFKETASKPTYSERNKQGASVIHRALQHKGGDVDAAAQHLNMEPMKLKGYMQNYQMDPKDYQEGGKHYGQKTATSEGSRPSNVVNLFKKSNGKVINFPQKGGGEPSSESDLISSTLKQHGGDTIKAAQSLGTTPLKLYLRAKKHGIETESPKDMKARMDQGSSVRKSRGSATVTKDGTATSTKGAATSNRKLKKMAAGYQGMASGGSPKNLEKDCCGEKSISDKLKGLRESLDKNMMMGYGGTGGYAPAPRNISQNMRMGRRGYAPPPANMGGTMSMSKADEPEVNEDQDGLTHIGKILKLHNQSGGSTYNLNSGDLSDSNHYVVSPYPDRTMKLEGHPEPHHVEHFISQNMDLLAQPGHSVGTWYDDESGHSYLDVSITTPDKKHALDLGNKHNQKAIFHLGSMSVIPTGDKGEG